LRSPGRGSAKSERIGQGRENARQFLKDNKDVMAKLDAEVRKTLGLAQGPAQPTAVPAPTNGAANGRVTTMPSAPPEPVKVPIAAKR
jgi:hypothetical protein